MMPGRWRKIARERMGILFERAEEEVGEHPERARRYVEMALAIGQKYRVRPEESDRRSYCRECKMYWKEGVTVDVRMDSDQGVMIWRCRECGNEKRYPYDEDQSI